MAIVVALCSCSSKQKPMGQIFERREASNNQLTIKYTYRENGVEKTDSATINNVVLPGDSIPVKKLLRQLKKQ